MYHFTSTSTSTTTIPASPLKIERAKKDQMKNPQNAI
jgi:hypothetical protein